MFEQSFVQTVAHSRNPVSWAVSFTGQAALVALAMLLPVIYTDQIPRVRLNELLFIGPPAPPPPPPRLQARPVVRAAAPVFTASGALIAPRAIPDKIVQIVEEAPDVDVRMGPGVPGGTGMPGAANTGVIASIITLNPLPLPAPPPQARVERPAAKSATPPRLVVGGVVQAAKLIRQVQPVYPPLAKQARVSGTVRLHAIISRDGTVQQLRVVEGHPLLVPAALEAVKQWVYSPTLLNGDPVEVDTRIDVLFTLNR